MDDLVTSLLLTGNFHWALLSGFKATKNYEVEYLEIWANILLPRIW